MSFGNSGLNGKTDEISIEIAPFVPPENGIKYGGFLQVSNKILQPEIFHNLTGNEFKLLYYLGFLRWKFPKANGKFRLAYSFLRRGTGLSEGTLKRVTKSLARKGRLLCVKVNKDWRTSKGNDYLTDPTFLQGDETTDQVDLSLPIPSEKTDQIDLDDGSKRSVIEHPQARMTDQKDLQININTSLIGGALRYHPNQIEGGVADPEKKSPNGQDLEKGVRLTADDMPGVSELKQKWRGEDEKKKTVGKGEGCNFHAGA